ncbi:MAG: lytic transglycosylase domain-containing protein [Candidatus Krumholzibacteriota bacterium]|nr:lytic transglycosylase domain-containing protein [Candidatus Krumholzibacteriota bacterium]
MHFANISFIAAVMLLSPAAGSASGLSGPESHLWRGEYKKAVSEMTDEKDSQKAAYLVMAGELDRALNIAGDTGNFRNAVILYKKKEWEKALDLTGGPGLEEPWLEAYRMLIRIDSFIKCGRMICARNEAAGILPFIDSFPGIRGHHLFDDLAALLARSAFDDFIEYKPFSEPDFITNTSAENLLTISGICYANGKEAEGRIFLLGALKYGIKGEIKIQLEKLLLDPAFQPDSLKNGEALEIARFAAFRGMEETAMKMIQSISGDTGYAADLLFLKGCLEEKKGRHVKSRKIFRDIFRSDASLSLKKESLLKIAAIDYKKKRFGKAASSFSLFGVYYPSDKRSEKMLDLSARIYVSERNWKKAIETWELIRKRGVKTREGEYALLSEAVLLHWLNKDDASAEILRELLELSDTGSAPAVLYWLSETDHTFESSLWREKLKDRFPDSFYSRALKDESGFFTIEADHPDSLDSLVNIESIELRNYAKAAAGINRCSAIKGHSAWKAFCYFIENGILDEAEECAGTLSNIFSGDRESLETLYAYSRSLGMVGLSMDILCGHDLVFHGENQSGMLRFPVPYGSIVSEEMHKRDIPFELVYGVIREESRFDRNAVSASGAVGLMQIMPSTGEWIGNKLKVDEVSKEGMFDPELNIQMGAWYLRFLLDRTEGSVVGALASYNAGYSRMAEWKKSFEPSKNPLIALELIGIEETRNYVKRVLGSMSVYRGLSSEKQIPTEDNTAEISILPGIAREISACADDRKLQTKPAE